MLRGKVISSSIAQLAIGLMLVILSPRPVHNAELTVRLTDTTLTATLGITSRLTSPSSASLATEEPGENIRGRLV
jgi:hypothetical protein